MVYRDLNGLSSAAIYSQLSSNTLIKVISLHRDSDPRREMMKRVSKSVLKLKKKKTNGTLNDVIQLAVMAYFGLKYREKSVVLSFSWNLRPIRF